MVILMYANLNYSGDVMFSTLASSVEDTRFEPSFCLTKYYKTVICFFSAKHVSFGVSVNLSRIGDVIVSTLTSDVKDRGFESRSCLTKYYKIGICCFSAKHATLRTKSNEKCLYQVRVITVFTVFRLLIDFVCLYTYEF